MLPDALSALPARSVRSTFAVMALEDGLDIATPVSIASPDTSAYMRTAVVAGDAGTPASETVTPPVLNEKTASPDGDLLPPPGKTRTEPERIAAPAPCVWKRRALRAGIEYAKLVAVWLSIVTATGCAAAVALPCPKNWTVPLIASSVGLTSATCVVQPPPSAKLGNVTVSPEAAESWTTGRVVIKNSFRSLFSPRSAIAETGTLDVNVKVPLKDGPLANRAWSRNSAIWPLAGIVVVPEMVSLPVESV